MSTLDVTNLKSKLALTPTKFYDKDDKEIGTLCRAWVNFNGTTNTGGNCTIRASFNVSSITDNTTGDYTINFTNAMPDANYSAVATSSNYSTGGYANIAYPDYNQTQTVSAFRFWTREYNNTARDGNYVCVQVFR